MRNARQRLVEIPNMKCNQNLSSHFIGEICNMTWRDMTYFLCIHYVHFMQRICKKYHSGVRINMDPALRIMYMKDLLDYKYSYLKTSEVLCVSSYKLVI
jgi:hypothetical protein